MFTAHGIRYLCKINGSMDAALYVKILEEDLLETLDYYEYDIDDIIFQHDNDSKHRAHITKNWLEANNILILDWPA